MERAEQFLKANKVKDENLVPNVNDLDGQCDLQFIAESGCSAEATIDVLHRHSDNLDKTFGAKTFSHRGTFPFS